MCFVVIFAISTYADEFSRYNEIRDRVKELGFKWIPAQVKNVDYTRTTGQEDLGLLWEEAKNKPLPSLPSTRALPAYFSWLEYNPSTGAFQIPAGKYVSNCNYQMQCGSCWAFGAIHAFEVAYRIAYKSPTTDIDMSQQILVSCSSNWGCNGGYPSTTADFLQNQGTWKESCYPYLAKDAPCGDACSEYPSKNYKITDWNSVQTDGEYASADGLKKALYNYGAVYTTMNVYDDFRYYYVGGVYQMTPGAKQLGGHAIAIVGYNDNEQCFIVQNSWDRLKWDENPPKPWGEDFHGDRGYFRIHYSQLSNQVRFGGTSIVFTFKP
jgi:C1A family cysteine protease